MILLWGIDEDPPLHAVRKLLELRGLAHVFIDQRPPTPPHAFGFGRRLSGRIGTLDLSQISAAYVRPVDAASLQEYGADESGPAIAIAREFAATLTTWLELAPILVVNRFSVQASNTSKLFQARTILAHGFSVPASLATTDPAAARAFIQRHGDVIYKSLSSVRSIVRRLGVDELERLGDVRGCPTLFQAHVKGTDYRVHVVGDRCIATMISSEGDDYRYAGDAEMQRVQLPDEVERRCVALSQALGLPFSGVDLRRDPSGTWFCFEVNPSPGFSAFEPTDSIEITTALIELLRTGTRVR